MSKFFGDLTLVNIVLILGVIIVPIVQLGRDSEKNDQTRVGQEQLKTDMSEVRKDVNILSQSAIRTETATTGFGEKLSQINGRIDGIESNDARQWDEIRLAKNKAESSVMREDFIQWKSELERVNGNVTAPALKPAR